MKKIFEEYPFKQTEASVKDALDVILKSVNEDYTVDNLKKAFSFIDLTSLNSTDTVQKIEGMCGKVNEFPKHYPEMPNVAAICVYPALVETVKKTIAIPNFNIAAVIGGFPASQTFIDVKNYETAMTAEKGATEGDMVISIGTFFTENYVEVFDEVKTLKATLKEKHLKVILETGELVDFDKIWKASVISMEAGADFIKTSTGKTPVAATLEAVYVMSLAIKAFYEKTGKKIGLKPAGGIQNGKQAIQHMAVVRSILGEEWLNPELFRIGASSLANNLLSEIATIEKGEETKVAYF